MTDSQKTYARNPTILKLWSFFGGLAFYTPVIVLYFLNAGVDLSLIVIAQAVYSIAIILAEVPTGVLADTIGHKKSVIIGSVVEVSAFVAFLLMPDIFGLMLGYALLGLGDAFQSGSTEALLYEGEKQSGTTKNYRKHFAQMMSFRTLAFAIGTAIAGILYGTGGMDLLPLIIVLSLLAKLAGGFVVFGARDVTIENTEQLKDSGMWRTFLRGMRYIKGDKTLKNIMYVKLLTLTGQYVLFSSYQPYFEENGVSAYFIGLVLTIGGLTNALTMRYIHLVEEYLSLDKIVLYCNLGLAATYALFAVASEPWLLVLSFILLQAQYNLQTPIMSDYVNDRTESDIRATVISGMSLAYSIANTGAKVLLGLMLAGFSFQFMIYAQVGYLVFGALLSYWLLVRCGCIYKLKH